MMTILQATWDTKMRYLPGLLWSWKSFNSLVQRSFSFLAFLTPPECRFVREPLEGHSELPLLRGNQFHFIWTQRWISLSLCWLLVTNLLNFETPFPTPLLSLWEPDLGSFVNRYFGYFFNKDQGLIPWIESEKQINELMFSTVRSCTFHFSAIHRVGLMVQSTDFSAHTWWLYRLILNKAKEKGEKNKVQAKYISIHKMQRGAESWENHVL